MTARQTVGKRGFEKQTRLRVALAGKARGDRRRAAAAARRERRLAQGIAADERIGPAPPSPITLPVLKFLQTDCESADTVKGSEPLRLTRCRGITTENGAVRISPPNTE